MAIAIASQSTLANTDTRYGIWDAPTGVTVGDLLICAHYIWADSSLTSSTGPSGFVRLFSLYDNEGGHFHLWWKIADSSDASASTFTWTDGVNDSAAWGGYLFRITGVDTTTPINASNYGVGVEQSPDMVAVTTDVADTLIMTFLAATWGATSANADTVPSGYTNNGTLYNPTSTNQVFHVSCGYMTQTSAGSTGTPSWTTTYFIYDQTLGTIAIAPLATGGGTPHGALLMEF